MIQRHYMNNKRFLFAAFALLLSAYSFNAAAIDRASLAQYAASLKGKKGASLKAALHPLLKPKNVLSYGSGSGATWSGFYKTDRNAETNECYNRYSSTKFYFTGGNTNRAIDGMNIEHSFPKSWWGGAKNNAYQDLYNLYPSDTQANSSKSNYPMDEVTDGKGDEGYDMVGYGVHVSGRAWEPGDQYKGDFSRSYMYMAVAYSDLTFSSTGLQTMANEDYPGLKSWASTLYIKWGKQDKVSELERDRNNAVAAIEANRNLFVDYPYLAEYVWGDSVGVEFDPYTSITTASDDDRYMHKSTTPDDPSVPDTPTANVSYKAVTEVKAGRKYILAASNGGTLHAMEPLADNKTFGYPTGTSVTDNGGMITAADSTGSFTFEVSGSGFTIRDSKGRYLYHNGTYKSISVTTDASQADIWTVTSNGDGTFKILTDDSYYIQYSSGYSSYGCYADAQGAMPALYEQQPAIPASIATVTDDRRAYNGAIYTVHGQYVGTSLNGLPHGLYIRNGKKFVVR